MKYRKRAGETKYFEVAGQFEVDAGISVVQSLAERMAALATFQTYLEAGAPGSLLSPAALSARISQLINISTGALTPAGMSGMAEADFFSTVELIVDTTDIIDFCFPVRSLNNRVAMICM